MIIISFYVNFFVKQRRKKKIQLQSVKLILWSFGVILWKLQIRNSFCRNLLELSAALWYNDANNLIRCGGFGGYNVACHGGYGCGFI